MVPYPVAFGELAKKGKEKLKISLDHGRYLIGRRLIRIARHYKRELML